LLGLIQPYSLRNVHGLGGRADADGEHTAMIAAIDARDPQALRALIHQHLATARDRLLESLSQRPAADPLAALRDMAPAPEAAFRKD
jgi:DNA-binding GntR family transcriptional regulator